MYSFKELKKASKLTLSSPEFRLAILANCSTQCLSLAVSGYARLSGLNLNVLDTDYNQVEFQLMNPNSETCLFQPDAVLIWLATDKLYEEFLDTPFSQREVFAETVIQKLEGYWELVKKGCNAQILQPNFTEINDKVLGNYSGKVASTFVYQIRKLNFLLEEAAEQKKEVFPIDLLSIQILLGQKYFFDAPLYYHAKMTVSMDAIPFFAKAVTDVLLAMNGKLKKCLIMDLDNTLWGGVIGDDGVGNIQIGELGTGHAFQNLQRWIRQLKEYGIILAVCSKNNEETAKEPFEKIPEMILRLSDISVFCANWEDKVANIQRIQEVLNISMDSLVFIDDNPYEREAVKQMLPDVTVPDLPEDPALYLQMLQDSDYFNTISFVKSSEDRTCQYQQEFKRKQLQTSYPTLKEYLKSLEMKGDYKCFDPESYARIAQLTQRSNQFNLRTVRYTESEIEQIAVSGQYITLYFTLKDKFGFYGLVSAVILKKKSKTDAFIDTWLMSCRVLKRGMEEFIMNTVMETAKKAGIQTVTAQYIPTPKNGMVKDIYRQFGFSDLGNGYYSIAPGNYRRKSTFIKKENHGQNRNSD